MVYLLVVIINLVKVYVMIISLIIIDIKEVILYEIWVYWGFKWVEREFCNYKKFVKVVSIDKFFLKILCWVLWGEYYRFFDKFFEVWFYKLIMFN